MIGAQSAIPLGAGTWLHLMQTSMAGLCFGSIEWRAIMTLFTTDYPMDIVIGVHWGLWPILEGSSVKLFMVK